MKVNDDDDRVDSISICRIEIYLNGRFRFRHVSLAIVLIFYHCVVDFENNVFDYFLMVAKEIVVSLQEEVMAIDVSSTMMVAIVEMLNDVLWVVVAAMVMNVKKAIVVFSMEEAMVNDVFLLEEAKENDVFSMAEAKVFDIFFVVASVVVRIDRHAVFDLVDRRRNLLVVCNHSNRHSRVVIYLSMMFDYDH